MSHDDPQYPPPFPVHLRDRACHHGHTGPCKRCSVAANLRALSVDCHYAFRLAFEQYARKLGRGRQVAAREWRVYAYAVCWCGHERCVHHWKESQQCNRKGCSCERFESKEAYPGRESQGGQQLRRPE